MYLGIKNAPGTFPRVIDVILSTLKWHSSLVYLEYIINCLKKIEENIELDNKFLSLQPSTGVNLKWKKCLFFTDTIDCLGHKIGPGRL